MLFGRNDDRGPEGPWSSFRPPRKNQRPNSSIQQVQNAEPFRRTQRMNWVRLSGDDGQVHDGATTGPRRGHKKSTTGFATGSRRVHDGLKPDAIIAVSAFADTKATSEGRSETGDPPSAGAVCPPRLIDVGP